MRKVALLAPLPPPYGGIAIWTQRMLNVQIPSDWKIVVVDEKVIGSRSVFGKNTKRSFFNEIRRCLSIWKRLISVLRDKETRIVHICIPAGLGSLTREIISAILAKAYKKKVVVHFRCTLPNMIKGRLQLFVFKWLVRLCDEIFILNHKSADFLEKQNLKIRFAIIPNFINKTELNKYRICSENINTVLYVGGVIATKGCDKIIETARMMPQIQFRLVGKVGLDAHNLPTNVSLLGEQNQEFVHEELLKADLFLFLSRFGGEGFSNALAEAMASGLPCIVSDWAANADMVENARGGCVLQNCSAKNICDAINGLRKQEIRQNYSNFNVQKVEAKYLSEKVVEQYFFHYENLLKT